MKLDEALKKKAKILIGESTTSKAIRNGKLSEVFICSNYPSDRLDKMSKASKTGDFKLNKLDFNSEELGAKCRRPYTVAVVGLLK